MLKENDFAIDFTLMDHTKKPLTLSLLKGKKIVVYFYPKDDTPGCTKEACSIRDNYNAILNKNCVVIGISPDSSESHQKFIAKYELPFYLCSDPDHRVAESYGVWGEKKMYGKVYMGIIRSTFIIGEDQKIIKVFPKVTPEGHGNEILKFL